MNISIKSLYDLENGHIILPTELVANAKLPNYEYVNFSANPAGLTAECMCLLEDDTKVIFNYYFDKQDRLLRLIAVDGIHSEVIFDREQEINKSRSRLLGQALTQTC